MKIWIDNPLVGTPENTGDLTFTLSPNPCNEQATIILALNKTSDVTLTVMNSLGQQVNSSIYSMQQPGSLSISLNTASFLPGIYYVRLNTKDASLLKKMIVVR
jgi:hypothetical protein